MRQFEIFGKTITQDSKPFVIAEIGNNHNGSLNLCKVLIERAKANGADAVKLQKRCPEKLFTKKLFNSPYQGSNSFGPTYGLHRKALEFDKEEWAELFYFADKIGIPLFSTAFDEDSVDFLEQFDPPAYKIASGCLKDIPLIKKIANLEKPMIISTGGGTWEDIERVFKLLYYGYVLTPFCFLHCVASYPNRADEMNLRVIQSMQERYKEIIIGLSDHYQGHTMALASFCLGARIFEKHFTVDHTMPGPDHALSLEPHELQEMVHELSRAQAAMGEPEKRFLPCEEKGIFKMGKGVHLTRTVKAGERLTVNELAIKSPAEGLPPYEIDRVIGKTLIHDLSTADTLTWEDIK